VPFAAPVPAAAPASPTPSARTVMSQAVLTLPSFDSQNRPHPYHQIQSHRHPHIHPSDSANHPNPTHRVITLLFQPHNSSSGATNPARYGCVWLCVCDSKRSLLCCPVPSPGAVRSCLPPLGSALRLPGRYPMRGYGPVVGVEGVG
jgi:hypothetical protein